MMKIGIFFGGTSREREISFIGGKTVFNSLDKTTFIPILVFVDSCGGFTIVDEKCLDYKDIRSFFPPQEQGYNVYVESLNLKYSALEKLRNTVGKSISPHEFSHYFDFAFLALHGPGAEDGSIQGLLEWYNIPYYGSGVVGSGIGIDKVYQNELLKKMTRFPKKTTSFTYSDWKTKNSALLFRNLQKKVGLPMVLKAPHQGSSIGISFLKKEDIEEFKMAVEKCFFTQKIKKKEWDLLDNHQKNEFVQAIAELSSGIGFPVMMKKSIIYHPKELKEKLDEGFKTLDFISITSIHRENEILVESFVEGQEFTCSVIQYLDEKPIALPPSEVIKVAEVFDFQAKYSAGKTRKRTPIEASLQEIQNIQKTVEKAFSILKLGVCSRIDGFLTKEGKVILHDPNTIAGMSPTSFIFKQMAEIGLNVTQSLTFFIFQSLWERMKSGKNTLLIEKLILELQKTIAKKDPKNSISLAIISSEMNDEKYAQIKTIFTQKASINSKIDLIFDENPVFTSIMFKDYWEEVIELTSKSTHPIILETQKKAKKIIRFFGN